HLLPAGGTLAPPLLQGRGSDGRSDAVAAVELGAAQGVVRAIDELLDGERLIGWTHDVADADAGRQSALTRGDELLRDALAHAFGHGFRRGGVRMDHDDHELVTAQTAYRIVR